MISFRQFVTEEGVPLYWQIVRHIKRGIVSGEIRDGDELPSRRVLSALLTVNPATVQKAYHLLEDEGLITSHSGAKSYMRFDAVAAERVRRELLVKEVTALVTSFKGMGISREEALALVRVHWGEETRQDKKELVL